MKPAPHYAQKLWFFANKNSGIRSNVALRRPRRVQRRNSFSMFLAINQESHISKQALKKILKCFAEDVNLIEAARLAQW